MLAWASVGLLADDEWYVVTLVDAKTVALIAPLQWTKSTSWRLPADYRPISQPSVQAAGASAASTEASAAATPAPAEFAWQVQVLSGSPGKPGPSLSPPSAARVFVWR